MIRIGRFLEICEVAAAAFNRRVGEFILLLVDVACLAVNDGMNPDQREIRAAMLIQDLPAIFPACRRMAIFAVYSQLAAMDVGMAVCASGSEFGENQAFMA